MGTKSRDRSKKRKLLLFSCKDGNRQAGFLNCNLKISGLLTLFLSWISLTNWPRNGRKRKEEEEDEELVQEEEENRVFESNEKEELGGSLELN